MLFQPKFKVGDTVVPNKRAPRNLLECAYKNSTVIGTERIHQRNRIMYFVPSNRGTVLGFYSDELDAYKKREPKNVGRDARGRFCKLVTVQSDVTLELQAVNDILDQLKDMGVIPEDSSTELKKELEKSAFTVHQDFANELKKLDLPL